MRVTEVGRVNEDTATGTQVLWKLSEPYVVRDWNGKVKTTTSYVVTSATIVPGSGPETYIFPADSAWSLSPRPTELPGSFRGDLNHLDAIEGFLAAVNKG